jgi:hypothetical protein
MLISKKTNYSKISQFFWQEHVEKASQVLSQSVATIDKYRKKTGLGESLGKMVRRQVRSLPDKTGFLFIETMKIRKRVCSHMTANCCNAKLSGN